MRKLISNLFLLGFMAAVVISVVVAISPHDTGNYLAASMDKYRLLHSTESPKIILVGGSNLAFSVDSEKIEKRFGLPVVNMGLHGDLGLRFMLNEAEPALGNGDIVLIFPEYELFYKIPLDGYSRELGSVIKFCPDCVSGISTPGQIFNVAAGFLQMAEGDILRSIKRPSKPEKIYFRQAFNGRGDLISHLKQADNLPPNNHVAQIQIISPNLAINELNSFYLFASSVNARVYFIFPAIPINEYNAQSEKFRAFYDLLTSELEIPILGKPQDFIYPEEYFYDTVYHMNRLGRDARTKRIVEFLELALQQ